MLFRSQAKQIKIAVAADLLSLTLLTPPGEFGADVVLGTTQRFGIPLGYGGPHAAYFATKDDYKRQVPGRIIGVSKDRLGNMSYRMSLQTREQHIRRDKATSNICTAQALLATMAGMYAVYHGPEGLKAIASQIHKLAVQLDSELSKLGVQQVNTAYFDTLKVKLNSTDDVEKIKKEAISAEINLRYISETEIGISIDETTNEQDVLAIIGVFANAHSASSPAELSPSSQTKLLDTLKRSSDFLTHEVFNLYHSETEMMRYIKRLERKDLALDTSMISLGSCTMKLNPASSMMPLSWPGFSSLHPFIPVDQAEGYQIMIKELSEILSEIAGLPGCSLQPNSGAQGEYAGLLAIRRYFLDKGEENRKLALIPSSAHGTNFASAALAGMDIKIVKCDEAGKVDMDDLKSKAEAAKESLAAIMITYPSTHGVFEEEIQDICQIIHDNGGQVYLDGANMNEIGRAHV